MHHLWGFFLFLGKMKPQNIFSISFEFLYVSPSFGGTSLDVIHRFSFINQCYQSLILIFFLVFQFAKMTKSRSNRKRKRDNEQIIPHTNDTTKDNGDTSQNEMANKTETEIVNNDAVNADNLENKSKTEGGIPYIETLNDPETEATSNKDGKMDEVEEMDDVEEESKTEPTVGGGIDVITAEPIARDHNGNDRIVLESEVEIDGLYETRENVAVGANIGAHSIYFSKTFERVVSFEPNPEIFKRLKKLPYSHRMV